MHEVVIGEYLRTAQTRAKPSDPQKDHFHNLRGDDLLARLLPELLNRAGVVSEEVDDLLVGSALGVSEQWTFGGRNIVMLANLSERVPARFLDQQCGSGMAAVQIGFMEIASGCADIVLACGAEHMTRVPIGPKLFNSGAMSMNPALYTDDIYAHWDMATTMNMGLTAEKLAGQMSIGREEMDRWAVCSHHRAARAAQAGFFADEILKIAATGLNGEEIIVAADQSIRPETSFEATAELKPAFQEGGSITAANSSPLSTGAGTMLLLSEEKARDKSIRPLASIKAIGFTGVDPTVMGYGPVPASRMALAKAGLRPQDIDFWEINEAFSVVVLSAIKELDLDRERVNIHGGAIALGHPLGATGIRITGTLARILHEQQGRYGCATACIGGGQGIAVILERHS